MTRQALHWFAPTDPAQYAPERFPVFIWGHGETAEDSFYGFPIPPGTEGVKLAREQTVDVTADPERLERIVSDDEGVGDDPAARGGAVGRVGGAAAAERGVSLYDDAGRGFPGGAVAG